MATESSSQTGAAIGSVQRLFVATLRLSTAMTLFGWEQMQRSARTLGSAAGLGATFNELQGTLDRVSSTLASGIGSEKKDTLQSVTDASEDVLARTRDSLNLVDPRQILRAASDLVRKMSSAFSDWRSEPKESGAEEPKPAAEVLS